MDEAVKAVVDAIEVPGPYPAFHAMMMERLGKDWPTLARALDRLRAAYHANEAEPNAAVLARLKEIRSAYEPGEMRSALDTVIGVLEER
jgi:cell pole-organizing protein PopZ